MAESLEYAKIIEAGEGQDVWLPRDTTPILVTASGYAMTPLKTDGMPNQIDSIDRIYTAYQEFMSLGGYSMTFDFYVKCMEACAYAFGDFRTWVTYNVTQLPLSNAAFNFILETVEYIKTGHRKFYPASYLAQITYDPTAEYSVDLKTRRERFAKISPLISGLTPDVINMWCSYDQGFKDMIVTCAIMFGGLQIR